MKLILELDRNNDRECIGQFGTIFLSFDVIHYKQSTLV